MWPRGSSWDILQRKLTAFYLCPKSQLEAKVKTFVIILQPQEISKEPRIYSIVWLLVLILMKIYNENKQSKVRKLQNVQHKEKRGNKKWNGGKSCVQGGKWFVEKLDVKQNKGRGDLRKMDQQW